MMIYSKMPQLIITAVGNNCIIVIIAYKMAELCEKYIKKYIIFFLKHNLYRTN